MKGTDDLTIKNLKQFFPLLITFAFLNQAKCNFCKKKNLFEKLVTLVLTNYKQKTNSFKIVYPALFLFQN